MKYRLLIREGDRRFFEAVRNGEKTIDTRAATDKYRKVKVGDVLNFVCGKDNLEYKVKALTCYPSIEALVVSVDFKKVMPFVSSVEEMKQVYYSFPGYKEKIKEFGLVAFELDRNTENA